MVSFRSGFRVEVGKKKGVGVRWTLSFSRPMEKVGLVVLALREERASVHDLWIYPTTFTKTIRLILPVC